MTDNTIPLDTATELAHRLIRAEAQDGSDPFMIDGHPNIPRGASVVRACFYYAVKVGPKVTTLYDNWGRGGMCDIDPDEWRAVWRTDDLLGALGTTFSELQAGSAQLNDAPVPPPLLGLDDFIKIARASREDAESADAAPDDEPPPAGPGC